MYNKNCNKKAIENWIDHIISKQTIRFFQNCQIYWDSNKMKITENVHHNKEFSRSDLIIHFPPEIKKNSYYENELQTLKPSLVFHLNLIVSKNKLKLKWKINNAILKTRVDKSH